MWGEIEMPDYTLRILHIQPIRLQSFELYKRKLLLLNKILKRLGLVGLARLSDTLVGILLLGLLLVFLLKIVLISSL